MRFAVRVIVVDRRRRKRHCTCTGHQDRKACSQPTTHRNRTSKRRLAPRDGEHDDDGGDGDGRFSYAQLDNEPGNQSRNVEKQYNAAQLQAVRFHPPTRVARRQNSTNVSRKGNPCLQEEDGRARVEGDGGDASVGEKWITLEGELNNPRRSLRPQAHAMTYPLESREINQSASHARAHLLMRTVSSTPAYRSCASTIWWSNTEGFLTCGNQL